MMLLGASPTPVRSRCDSAASGKPLPRTIPARSQAPTKISRSRSTDQATDCRDKAAIKSSSALILCLIRRHPPSPQPSPRKRGEGARLYPRPVYGEREGPAPQAWEGEGLIDVLDDNNHTPTASRSRPGKSLGASTRNPPD